MAWAFATANLLGEKPQHWRERPNGGRATPTHRTWPTRHVHVQGRSTWARSCSQCWRDERGGAAGERVQCAGERSGAVGERVQCAGATVANNAAARAADGAVVLRKLDPPVLGQHAWSVTVFATEQWRNAGDHPRHRICTLYNYVPSVRPFFQIKRA